MGKLKKHSVLIALTAAIIIIVVMSTSIYAKKDQGTFYVRDLQGSREAIEDAVISGELRDGYHQTSFRIESGLVKTNTELFDQPMYAAPNQPLTWGAKLINGVEYYISNGGPVFEVVASKRVRSAWIPAGTATVNLPVNYQKSSLNENDNDNSFTYTNHLEYGLANIGEKVYFTLPTTTDYTGNNGIYELKFSDNWGYRAITGDSGK